MRARTTANLMRLRRVSKAQAALSAKSAHDNPAARRGRCAAKLRRIVSSEPKPQRRGDAFDRLAGIAEPALRRLDAQPLDRLGGRTAGRLLVAAQEGALAHAGAGGETGNRQFGAEIFADPGMELVETSSPRCSDSVALNCAWPPGRLRKTTSWRATASADLASEVLLDQRERKIDARGDAGRGPDVAVADENRVALRLSLRDSAAPVPAQRVQCVVDAAPAQQASGGEQHRARADRGVPARLARRVRAASPAKPHLRSPR